MRFNEFIAEATIPSNYEIAPNMRPQPGPPKPIPNFVAKSALDVKQDPADISRQEQPAYQRKANQQPPMSNTAGNARPGVQQQPTNNNLGKLGKVSPGEPTMGQPVPNQVRPAAPAVPTVQPAPNQVRPTTTTTPPPAASTNVQPTTQPTNNVSAPVTTPTATTATTTTSTPTAPAKGSMTSWQQGPNASAPAKAPPPTAYNVGYRAGAAYNAYQKTPPEQSRIQAGINAANAAIKTTPPAPPAAKIAGPTSQYIPPRTPEQAKAIANKITKGLGKGMGSDSNFYPAGVGAQGTIFQNKQYIKDLEHELATKGSDPTQQAELLKYRAIVKAQEEQVKKDAEVWRKEYPDSKLNGQGQQGPSTSQSTPAPTQQAPAIQQKSVTAPQNTTQQAPTQQAPNTSTSSKSLPAFDAGPGDTWDGKPAAAPQARSVGPSQNQSSSGYKGSAGSQAIQQLNPDRIQDVNKIYAGDTINLPGGGTYTIKQGDTLDQIARNQSAPAAPAAPAETPSTVLTPKSTDVEKLPTEKVKETSDDKSLNRIKSLAGLK